MAAAGGSFIAARSGNGCQEEKEKEVTDRELWAGVLYQMAAPVLSNMSEGKLHKICRWSLVPLGMDATNG